MRKIIVSVSKAAVGSKPDFSGYIIFKKQYTEEMVKKW